MKFLSAIAAAMAIIHSAAAEAFPRVYSISGPSTVVANKPFNITITCQNGAGQTSIFTGAWFGYRSVKPLSSPPPGPRDLVNLAGIYYATTRPAFTMTYDFNFTLSIDPYPLNGEKNITLTAVFAGTTGAFYYPLLTYFAYNLTLGNAVSSSQTTGYSFAATS